MNCSVNKWLKPISYVCLLFFVVSCDFRREHKESTQYNAVGIYYNVWKKYGLQYVILTKDSIYANVLETRDSAIININRWHQPYLNVWLNGFVPIGIQWREMICYIYADKDSNGNYTGLIYGKDSAYIYEHGIRYSTDNNKAGNCLFIDPDYDFTFAKYSCKTLVEKGVILRKFKSLEEAEAHLCIGDSSVFEGIRKVSKAELRTLLWGE